MRRLVRVGAPHQNSIAIEAKRRHRVGVSLTHHRLAVRPSGESLDPADPLGTVDLNQRFARQQGNKTIQYRFSTPAVVGAWRDSRECAVRDALDAGQAHRDPADRQRIVLREWVTIEERDEPGND